MNNACKAAIEKAEAELFELYEKQNSKEDFKKQIDIIRSVLRSAQKDAAKGIITKEFASKYIDKIFVTPQGDEMKMDIKIFTGETCEKYLSQFRGRSGHISKKMIEAYENSMK